MNTAKIPTGAPCWIDLITSNTDRACEFYTALFGWSYEVGDAQTYGGYIQAFKDGQLVAGIMANDSDTSASPDMWSTYLRVEDIQARVAAAVAGGAKVLVDAMDVPEQGKMAMLSDPTGAMVSMWEFGPHTGFQAHGITGTATWHELWTKDYPVALKFYHDIFGWDMTVMSDSADFKYSTLGAGPDALAGIMDASTELPEQVPSNWQVYFQVENADATVALALSIGATVIQSAEDTPFGRLAGLTDPSGALFKIIGPTES